MLSSTQHLLKHETGIYLALRLVDGLGRGDRRRKHLCVGPIGTVPTLSESQDWSIMVMSFHSELF